MVPFPPRETDARASRRRPGAAMAVAVALGMALVAACHGDVSSKMAQVRAFQESGDQQSAVNELHKILDAHPKDPEANYRLGVSLLALGRVSEAVFPLRTAAESKRYGRSAGILLASTLMKTDNAPQAIEAADRVLALDPKNRTALEIRGEAAITTHDGEQALDSATRLLELDPKNLRAQSMRADALSQIPDRHDEAEAIYRKLEKADWGDKDKNGPGRMCLAIGELYKSEQKTDEAVKQFQECGARYKDRNRIVVGASDQLDELGHHDESMAVLRAAFEAHPDRLTLRTTLSERLVADGKYDEAENLIREAAEKAKTGPAWQAVANVRRLSGNREGALEAVEKGLSIDPKDDDLRFFHADLLVELGRLKEAEKEAEKLQSDVYRKIIHGRLALERGHPKTALAQFDDVERIWPDNAGVRVQAARAALELGDESRGMSELREAARADPKHNDAALLLAHLYLVRGKYEYAKTVALSYIKNRGVTGPDAHIIAARAVLKLGKPKAAYVLLEDLANRNDGAYAGAAVAEMAQMDAHLLGPKDALARIEKEVAKRKLDLADPQNATALRELLQLEESTGARAAALARLDGLIRAHPKQPLLLALRGHLRMEGGDVKGAEADFTEALALDPKQAFALAGQGMLLRRRGDLAGAIQHFEEASKLDPTRPDYPYFAAQSELASGKPQQARAHLEKALQIDPGYAPACNDLAWLLAQDPKDQKALDRALVLAERAQRLQGGAEILDTLGYVQLQRGDLGKAVETLQKSVAAKPDYATARYHLGLALLRQGNREAARGEFQSALAGGAFPEEKAARVELARLQKGEEASR